ncbi:MAG: ribonuclease HI family protein [Acidobacteria bacterium]|nr:ribonuclease HI family protein [Acidobacteriota bacterium]
MEFWIDGGSRGNPGPAGYGVVVGDDKGQVIDELYASIGAATNNVAEYRGLLAALHYAIDHQCEHITIRSDSLLLVCQMKGEYRVKNAGLKPLHAEARLLASRLGRVRFVHVRREQNAEADALANRAMDEGKKQDASSKEPEEAGGPAFPTTTPTPGRPGNEKHAAGTWPPTGRLF